VVSTLKKSDPLQERGCHVFHSVDHHGHAL
jgi:hypothetical protein